MWVMLFLTFFASGNVTEADLVNDVLSQFPAVLMSAQERKFSEAQELAARGAFDLVVEGEWRDTAGNYENSFFSSRIRKPTSLFGLDLYAGFRQSRGEIPVYYGELETLDRGEWNFGLNLPLLRGFWIDNRRAELKKSEIQVKRQTLEFRATELREVEKSLLAYWNWKVALERWRIQKNLLDIAKTRDQWLEKRTRSGDIAAFERKDNLRTVLLRQSALLQAELDLKSREAQLAVFLSSPDLKNKIQTSTASEKNMESRWPVPQQVAQLNGSVDQLMQEAIKERPEFSIIAAQIAQLEISKDLQDNQFLPKLDFRAEYSKDRGVGGANLGDDNSTLSLQFEVPLQYRSVRGQRNQITAEIRRAEFEREFLTRQWRSELEIFQKNLAVATERRSLALQEFELARQLEKGERIRLRQGDTNVLIVNLREQASAEASLRVIETTADVLRAYSSLKIRLGKIPFIAI